MDYVGIDLGCSAVSTSPTSAVAVLDHAGKLKEEPRHFRRAAELVEVLKEIPRDRVIIAVDAPRSVPDWGRENYARRSCETELQKATREHVGSFAGVASLFIRSYEIEAQHFADAKVIETYPRAVWARLGLPHRPKDYKKKREEVWACVETVTGVVCREFSGHQLDAVLCAYTAWCYGNSRVDCYGNAGEGALVLPSPSRLSGPAADESIKNEFRRFPSQM